jgi:uncharacterized membrane protein YgcG
VIWIRIGKDPEQGTIIPQFEPPFNISPADAGFIYHQKYKPQQFSAALIDLAVEKLINIEVKREGMILKSTTYTLHKGSNTNLALEELPRRAYDWSLPYLYELKISNGYDPSIASLSSKLKQRLESKFLNDSNLNNNKKGLFSLNSGAANWGFFFLLFIGFVSIVVSKMVNASMIEYSLMGLIAVGVVMQFVFYKIMPAYNKEGRKILDHLLGFRMYLSTAEERRFDKLSPPHKDLKLFERLLPYAIALNCENEWASKFENVLADAAENAGYTPTYLSGDVSRNMSISTFSSGISSGLSSRVASASTAPSSSSGGGSSGSGSSGGGGGGGGGGGW